MRIYPLPGHTTFPSSLRLCQRVPKPPTFAVHVQQEKPFSNPLPCPAIWREQRCFCPKGKDQSERLAAQFDTVKCVKNVIKLNPLIFFRGEIPIYYERSITPRLGIEVGVGVTLRNYLALSFTGDDADDFAKAPRSFRSGTISMTTWSHKDLIYNRRSHICGSPRRSRKRIHLVHLHPASSIRMTASTTTSGVTSATRC